MRACEAEVEKSFDLEACRKKYVGEYCLDPESIPRPMRGTKFLAFSTYWYLVNALKFSADNSASAEGFEEAISKFCRDTIQFNKKLT